MNFEMTLGTTLADAEGRDAYRSDAERRNTYSYDRRRKKINKWNETWDDIMHDAGKPTTSVAKPIAPTPRVATPIDTTSIHDS
jgi:hypothetical protein